MESSVPCNPPAVDGDMATRTPWKRNVETHFVWVAPSPSPAEVAELEVQFPYVIQVPTEALEVESSGWEERAVIARSFHRWVPPDVIIQEIRCAGIVGEIEALCLSHRCYIFRFADHISKEAALGRPWIANGQSIETEAWSPEFIPSVDSVAMALLWVRLPNLPMEFWTDKILRSILAPAGHFEFFDSSTKERSRGGFARACVRVDLRRPLRPGVRVKGSRAPFWQQFAFEHLEGICPRCGSLHLHGSCSSLPKFETSSAGAKFGPWMATLRQPRSSQGQSMETRVNALFGFAHCATTGSSDGWQVPAKVARRRLGKASLASDQHTSVVGSMVSGKKKADIDDSGMPGV